MVKNMVLENVLLDDFKCRWSTFPTIKLDFRPSNGYKLVVFTYLLGELT